MFFVGISGNTQCGQGIYKAAAKAHGFNTNSVRFAVQFAAVIQPVKAEHRCSECVLVVLKIGSSTITQKTVNVLPCFYKSTQQLQRTALGRGSGNNFHRRRAVYLCRFL